MSFAAPVSCWPCWRSRCCSRCVLSRAAPAPLRGALHGDLVAGGRRGGRGPAWRSASTCPRRCCSPRSRRWRSRSPSRSRRSRCRRARVDHARHRPLALDAGRPTSSPTGSSPPSARPAPSSASSRAPCASAPSPTPTRPTPCRRRPPTTRNARGVVDGQVADGATATGDALHVALDTLRARQQRQEAAAVGDRAALRRQDHGRARPGRGRPRRGQAEDPDLHRRARHARGDGPQPDPFQPPLPVAPDPETLRQIAKASGGRAFTAEDDTQLSTIYRSLGSQLGQKRAKKEITAAFAIVGLVLLLGAGLASARTAGRVV